MKVTTLWQQKITLGTASSAKEVKRTVLPLMTNAQSFGVDLEEAGLADTVGDPALPRRARRGWCA